MTRCNTAPSWPSRALILSNRDISNKAVRNSMLPSLGLYAYYGGSGLGGTLSPNATFCPSSSGICINRNRIPSQFLAGPVGYGNTLSQLVDSTAPDKGIGVSLNIPILNRTAQANQVRSELELRQAQVRLQQLENQIRIEVRNAQFDVQQNRASVDAAQAAVNLARQTRDAEQKKLEAGVSNPTNVLQTQSSLTSTESTLVSALAAYEKARVELDRATGLSARKCWDPGAGCRACPGYPHAQSAIRGCPNRCADANSGQPDSAFAGSAATTLSRHEQFAALFGSRTAPHVFAQNDRLSDLFHGFAFLPALALNTQISFLFGQPQVTLQNSLCPLDQFPRSQLA